MHPTKPRAGHSDESVDGLQWVGYRVSSTSRAWVDWLRPAASATLQRVGAKSPPLSARESASDCVVAMFKFTIPFRSFEVQGHLAPRPQAPQPFKPAMNGPNSKGA